MSAKVRRRNTCRLCDGTDLRLALALEPTPPANAFVTRGDKGSPQEVFPLDIFFCGTCTHVQLLDVVDARVLFEHYVYVSGTSPSFVTHFERYSDTIARLASLAAGGLVVDIGSNDGTLLRAFRTRHGAEVLGIDPARNLAAAATASGIETISEFFSPALANEIAGRRGKAKVITANNVFAHVDDLGSVADGIRGLLAPDGLFVFEVSYLLSVLEDTLFDTIYHEHLSYHAVWPLIGFFEKHGLELIAVDRIPTHGGSIRGVVQLGGGRRPVDSSVSRAVALERASGLQEISAYTNLSKHIDHLGQELRALLDKLSRDGKTIAGFGAPAKATTLMYQFGIGAETIKYIVDDSPLKQGLFTPGLHVPVVSSAELDFNPPDYLLVLAWNFAGPIIAKHEGFRSNGGRFIVPLPNVEIR